ncbi:MAG: arginine deiminase-related protein [bacterium]|nr:arginine deiminase-related protein [bacterium]
MCKPLYFDVTEKDEHGNTHMNPLNRPSKALALEQHEKLVALYKELGLTVEFIEPVEGLRDMTFAANCGIVFTKGSFTTTQGKKWCFLSSNFRPERRRGEKEHYRSFFQKRNYYVLELDPHIFFEGSGDVIPFTNDVLFVGYGFRTSQEATLEISAKTGKIVIPLELQKSGEGTAVQYHLDTAMTVLPGKCPTVIVYPGCFTNASYRVLRQEVKRYDGVLVEATYADAASLALNTTVIPIAEIPLPRRASLPKKCKGVVVTADTASQELLNIFARLGYRPQTTPLSEFIKSGGGAFCLTKILC